MNPIVPSAPEPAPTKTDAALDQPANPPSKSREIGGREGLEPTRYGDWEMRGRCIDF